MHVLSTNQVPTVTQKLTTFRSHARQLTHRPMSFCQQKYDFHQLVLYRVQFYQTIMQPSSKPSMETKESRVARCPCRFWHSTTRTPTPHLKSKTCYTNISGATSRIAGCMKIIPDRLWGLLRMRYFVNVRSHSFKKVWVKKDIDVSISDVIILSEHPIQSWNPRHTLVRCQVAYLVGIGSIPRIALARVAEWVVIASVCYLSNRYVGLVDGVWLANNHTNRHHNDIWWSTSLPSW